MDTTTKPPPRSPNDDKGKSALLGTETSSTPEHVPDIAGFSGGDSGALRREERIRTRAFELYLARGDAPGSETEDWMVAEAQILDSESEGLRRSGSSTASDASEVGEEDPGAADGDPQVSQSLRSEAAATALPKTKRSKR